jgi:hypothetical protein
MNGHLTLGILRLPYPAQLTLKSKPLFASSPTAAAGKPLGQIVIPVRRPYGLLFLKALV